MFLIEYFKDLGFPSWYVTVAVCSWSAFVGLAFYIAFAFAKRAGEDFDDYMDDDE